MSKKSILKNKVEISGVGLHTGKQIHLEITAGEVGTGIKFIRKDMEPPVAIAGDVSCVYTTERGTTLKSGEAVISTIEHLMAAFNALGIEDAVVYSDGPEIPILDGSAAGFIQKLKHAGLEEEDSNKEVFEVKEPFVFYNEATGSEYRVFPSDKFELSVVLDFSDDTLGDMIAVMKDKDDFADHFADSRTFVFLSDLEPLFDKGLIKGGDIDNAIVIVDKQISEEEVHRLKTKLNRPNAVIEDNVLSITPLRYKNEPARHKLLDLMGDLMLLGRSVKAKIMATRPGHTANVEFVHELKARYVEQRKRQGVPVYHPDGPVVFEYEDIVKYLPHRYPFLLVDKVIELSDTHIVGIKNITFNEAFFMGHFPDNPIFPGVLQIEALAQTGGVLALTTVSDGTEKWDTYFLKIDNVKFKSKVVPGDTLIMKMELMGPIRRGIVQMKASAYVGSILVTEGELTAQIIKRSDD